MSSEEEDWDPDGLAFELEVACGMRRDRISQRTASEKIWRAIAAGEAHETTKLHWVAYVAQQLVEGLIDKHNLDDKLRGREALLALELYDKRDLYAELRGLIDTWMCFDDVSGPEPRVTSPPRPRDILHVARDRGMFDEVDDRRALESIRRQLNKVIEQRSNSRV